MKRYPDVNNIVRPTTMPPPFPPQLTTRNTGKMYPIHDHCAFVNREGEGVTDVVASHYHRVRGAKILPDESDGHTHAFTGLPCGAGAALPMTNVDPDVEGY